MLRNSNVNLIGADHADRGKMKNIKSVVVILILGIGALFSLSRVDFSTDNIELHENRKVHREVRKKEAPVSEFGRSTLLISSHKALSLFDPVTNIFRTIDVNHGVYYGQLPFFDATDVLEELWIVGSPEYTNPKESSAKDMKVPDAMLRFDVETMEMVPGKHQLNSFFTHDSIVSNGHVFVASTFTGMVDVVKREEDGNFMEIGNIEFQRKNHINSLAVQGDFLFVLLNNLDLSQVAVVDISGLNQGTRKKFKKLCVVDGIGKNSHNLILEETTDNDFVSFYSLSSGESSLVRISFSLEDCKTNSKIHANKEVLLKYQSNYFKKPFVKGLSIINQIAFFASSEYTVKRTERANVESRLIGFDLTEDKVIFEWPQEQLGSVGLINVIGAPFLSSTGTYKEMSLECDDFFLAGSCTKPVSDENDMVMKKLQFSKEIGIAYGMSGDGVQFIKMPFRLDHALLAAELKKLNEEVEWTYREDVNNHFILMVTKEGLIDDQTKRGPFKPVKGRIESMPYTEKVLKAFGSPVSRARYMKLVAGDKVISHVDQTKHLMPTRFSKTPQPDPTKADLFYDVDRYSANTLTGFWGRRFRVHIPVISNPEVIFVSQGFSLYMEPGYAYLFDNAYQHTVLNPSKSDRVHLVFDTVGSPKLFDLVQYSEALIGKTKRGKDTEEVTMVPFLEYHQDVYKSIFGKDIPEERLKTFKIEPGVERVNDPLALKDIVYEYWIDEKVYHPMSPTAVRKGFDYIRSLRLGCLDDSALSPLFDGFVEEYTSSCYYPFTNDQALFSLSKCQLQITNFIKEVLTVEECLSGENDLGADLLSAVEPFTRMFFYQCSLSPHFSNIGPACQVGSQIKGR